MFPFVSQPARSHKDFSKSEMMHIPVFQVTALSIDITKPCHYTCKMSLHSEELVFNITCSHFRHVVEYDPYLLTFFEDVPFPPYFPPPVEPPAEAFSAFTYSINPAYESATIRKILLGSPIKLETNHGSIVIELTPYPKRVQENKALLDTLGVNHTRETLIEAYQHFLQSALVAYKQLKLKQYVFDRLSSSERRQIVSLWLSGKSSAEVLATPYYNSSENTMTRIFKQLNLNGYHKVIELCHLIIFYSPGKLDTLTPFDDLDEQIKQFINNPDNVKIHSETTDIPLIVVPTKIPPIYREEDVSYEAALSSYDIQRSLQHERNDGKSRQLLKELRNRTFKNELSLHILYPQIYNEKIDPILRHRESGNYSIIELTLLYSHFGFTSLLAYKQLKMKQYIFDRLDNKKCEIVCHWLAGFTTDEIISLMESNERAFENHVNKILSTLNLKTENDVV